MRIRPVHTDHHRVCNFVVEAENPTECVLLQQFWKANYDGSQRLFMHSYGGNIFENVASFCFGWRDEEDFNKTGYQG